MGLQPVGPSGYSLLDAVGLTSLSEPRRRRSQLCCSCLKCHLPAAPLSLAMDLQRLWASSLTTATLRARKTQQEANQSIRYLPPTLTSRRSPRLRNGYERLPQLIRHSFVTFTTYSLSHIGSPVITPNGSMVTLLQVRAHIPAPVDERHTDEEMSSRYHCWGCSCPTGNGVCRLG